MKRLSILMITVLFFITACSHKDGDSLQNPTDTKTSAPETSAIDYTQYEDLDVDSYADFNSLPADLKKDVYAKALLLAGLMDKSRECKECNAASAGMYSTLNSVACLLYHCWKPMVTCVIDGECRTQLMSLGDCVLKGGDAMMLCCIDVFSQPNEKLMAMMSSIGKSGCMPDPVPNCALPTNRKQIAPVSLADLEGDWYVVRGYSPVYDCFSGQRYSFHRISETVSTYDYTYFPKDKDTPTLIKCTTTAIPFSPGETKICPGRFRVNYTAYGMPGIDDWFVLSHPNSDYLLIYYCGASPMDAYVGGIVLSRSLDTNIPEDILKKFEDALANAGIADPISLDDFCTPDNTGITYDDTAETWESALLLSSLY